MFCSSSAFVMCCTCKTPQYEAQPHACCAVRAWSVLLGENVCHLRCYFAMSRRHFSNIMWPACNTVGLLHKARLRQQTVRAYKQTGFWQSLQPQPVAQERWMGVSCQCRPMRCNDLTGGEMSLQAPSCIGQSGPTYVRLNEVDDCAQNSSENQMTSKVVQGGWCRQHTVKAPQTGDC